MAAKLTNPVLISVVMGVNRDDGSLRDTIASILSQSFADFEFIIVNDGNDDGVAQVVEQVNDNRIVHIAIEKSGLTKALNVGIRKAKGKYIARQDAGDFSLAERFKTQIEFLNDHPEICLVGTGVTESTVDGDLLGDIIFHEDSAEIKKHLPFQNNFCHGSVMFSKEIAEKVGLYREAFIKAQDYDFWLRIAQNYELHNIPVALYHRVIDKESISIKTKAQQEQYAQLARDSALARLAGRQEPLLQIENNFEGSAARISKNHQDGDYYLHCGRLLLTNRKQKDARRIFWHSLKAWPYNKYAYLFFMATFIPQAMIDSVENTWKRYQKSKGIQV